VEGKTSSRTAGNVTGGKTVLEGESVSKSWNILKTGEKGEVKEEAVMAIRDTRTVDPWRDIVEER